VIGKQQQALIYFHIAFTKQNFYFKAKHCLSWASAGWAKGGGGDTCLFLEKQNSS